MDWAAVEVRDATVIIDHNAVTRGEREPPPGCEFQTGGAWGSLSAP